MKENPNKQKYTRVPLPIRVPQELKDELAEAAKRASAVQPKQNSA